MRPLNSNVLVRPDEPKTMSGALHLPKDEDTRTGVILAVGPGDYGRDGERRPCCVSVGDRVMYGTYSGTRVEVDGDRLLLMRESDLLVVLG